MRSLYHWDAHPLTEERKAKGPVTVATVTADHTSRLDKFNDWVALKITTGVGTMWCAYLFAGLACLGLPAVIAHFSVLSLVQWVAQTFLQLVLLSVIIVGQNIQAQANDLRSEQTYNDAEAILHGQEEMQKHLAAQDEFIQRVMPPADVKE